MKQLIAVLVLTAAAAPALWSQVSRQEVSRVSVSTVRPDESRSASLSDLDDAAARLQELNTIHDRLMEAAGRMATLYASLSGRLEEVCASKRNDLCEASAHDTLEYMELQNRMQRESRRFTTISDLMKTRHDTAKASIQNMR